MCEAGCRGGGGGYGEKGFSREDSSKPVPSTRSSQLTIARLLKKVNKPARKAASTSDSPRSNQALVKNNWKPSSFPKVALLSPPSASPPPPPPLFLFLFFVLFCFVLFLFLFCFTGEKWSLPLRVPSWRMTKVALMSVGLAQKSAVGLRGKILTR